MTMLIQTIFHLIKRSIIACYPINKIAHKIRISLSSILRNQKSFCLLSKAENFGKLLSIN